MLNYFPIIGTAIEFIFCLFLAIPFYFLWGYVAPIYFYWLPTVYQSIPFWDCVWLFMTISILKVLFPKFVNVEQKNEK